MNEKINQFIDQLSNYFANRKGLLPVIGLLLVLANGILQFLPIAGWFVSSSIMLHIGVILAIIGMLLAWAL